ncbi:hypothetical protein Pmar_PMAR009947 [Perkinsus marinus ATCC 50983]|uniref:Uncharacterized protein n=1 Tax=Perkinsus marinus (strain ATCC 50983 / TXsc) TaxID=423536 RepID=C5L2N9_PERM5|nr:hypothetical protein Pmar_PMAR009947 [Perkinsus marinus ATCC 50983]EER08954.1 hypothetical protein Pmar_PMAR009947 [Perkinsus marinus ATCC 50983]|eukprot:XP_002777138.1 hypothetical protein Pmar_PMAR009947 [Perkinsus marinus ATCC 50983]
MKTVASEGSQVNHKTSLSSEQPYRRRSGEQSNPRRDPGASSSTISPYDNIIRESRLRDRTQLAYQSDSPPFADTSKPPYNIASCGLLTRSLAVSIGFVVAFFVAACWKSLGVTWIYDSSLSYSPVISCPNVAHYSTYASDAPACRVTVKNYSLYEWTFFDKYGDGLKAGDTQCQVPYIDQDAWAKAEQDGTPINNKIPIVCDWDMSCADAVQEQPNGQCAVVISSPITGMTYFTHPCSELDSESFCDAKFQLQPADMVAIRGVFLGMAFLVVLTWVVVTPLGLGAAGFASRWWREGRLRMGESLVQERRAYREQIIDPIWDNFHNNAPPLPTDSATDFGPPMNGGMSARSSLHSQGSVTSTMYGQKGVLLSTPRSEAQKALEKSYGYLPRNDVQPVTTMDDITVSAASDARHYRQFLFPRLAFNSGMWARKLRKYQALKEERIAGQREAHAKSLRTMGVCFVIFCFCVLIIYAALWILPQNLTGEFAMALDVFKGDAPVGKLSSFFFLLAFGDVLYEWIILVTTSITGLCRAVPGVGNTPPLPRWARHGSNKTASRSSSGYFDDEDELECAESGYVPGSSTCILLMVHRACFTAKSRKMFLATLKRAVSVAVNEDDVFVVDYGHELCPQDDTEMVTKEAFADVHYLYVPEDSEALAGYWASKYWIPFLFSRERCGDYIYALLLRSGEMLHKSFRVPERELLNNPYVKGLALGDRPNSMGVEGFYYDMIDASWSRAETLVSGSLTRPSGPVIWERNTLELVLGTAKNKIDPTTLGVTLLEQRDKSKVKDWPTLPHASINCRGHEYTRTVMEGGLPRRVLCLLREFFLPSGWCSFTSLMLKPFYLGQLLFILFDILRPFILGGMVVYDPLGFLVTLCAVAALLYVHAGIHLMVSFGSCTCTRSGETQGRAWASFCGTLMSFLLYPLTKLMHDIIFRPCSLIYTVMEYTRYKYRSTMTIVTREDVCRDLPPIPPHTEVDWYTVWWAALDDTINTRKEVEVDESKQ